MIISLSNFSFLFGNDIKSQTNYKWKGDTLLINLVIYNNSRNSLYFQKEHWIMEGDSVTNYYWTYSEYPIMINQITYFPSFYTDVSYKISTSYKLENFCFPKFVELLPNKYISIDIIAPSLKNILIDSLNYNFKFSIPIYQLKILKKSAKYLNLPLNDIILKNTDFQMIFTKLNINHDLGVNDYWIKNNEEGFCTKKYVKKEEIYNFYQIFRVYKFLIFMCEISE